MTFSPPTFRAAFLACAAVSLPLSWANAAEPVQVVFQNGRSVPISSVALQADKLVITTSANGFTEGQSFPLASVDHVYGEKPAQINLGIALLLTGKPADALKLLEPVLAEQKITAKIPGNFWLEAARAALVAYAVSENTAKTTEIGKEISEATPIQGIDPFVSLGKALLLPASTSPEDRETALRDLASDNFPADVAAYASFYLGNLLSEARRDKDPAKALQQTMATLEAYLVVPTLYPAGGMILNGVAESKAAEILVALGRREEAIALLTSSIRQTGGTLVAVDAAKRVETLK
jgi:tetratricopeptide (TPR) repeat protein